MKLRLIITKNQIGFLNILGYCFSEPFVKNNKLKIFNSAFLCSNNKNYKKIFFAMDKNEKMYEIYIHIKELRNKSINIIDYKFTVTKD
nr:MAG TPA: hypothetical protein [Caudoviricetes sp.]